MVNSELRLNAHKLIRYMATSACNLVGEPPMYGPFRLVDATSRLIDILEKIGAADEVLLKARDLIEEKKYLVMHDEEAFVSFLNELVMKLVEGIREGE